MDPTKTMWTQPKQFASVQNRFGPIEGQGIRHQKVILKLTDLLKTGLINANAPLKNGLGRFIPQLMRITIKFCKESPHSTGIREFIEKDIVEFAKKNPGTAIYLKPRRHRTPVVVAEYRKFESSHLK